MTGTSRPHPRILIRTLPLGNANYGGILQAYALQTAVKSFGGAPVTDVSRRSGRPQASIVRSLTKRMALALGLSRGKTAEWLVAETKQQVNSRLTAFIEEQIKTVEVFDHQGILDRELVSRFDQFLVGSDQVWRKAYGDVPSYMFDFVEDQTKQRYSYAASFGLDNIDEYDDALRETAVGLLARFDAVSVRESSALGVCTEHFSVAAEQHVDPTMLLNPDHYRAILGRSSRRASGHVISYILDDNSTAEAAITSIARRLGSAVTSLNTAPPPTYRAFLRGKARYTRPSVEDWIASIDTAEMVVTDSFHGTVFAILFNTPFVVFANATRGASRFESLLTRFGLESRLVSTVEQSDAAAAAPIDWAAVNELVSRERERGRSFLESHVQHPRSLSS